MPTDVHTKTLKQHFRASYCSCANFVNILLFLFVFLFPFFLAQFTPGFWVKDRHFTKQPAIKLLDSIILQAVIESPTTGTRVVYWSPSPQILRVLTKDENIPNVEFTKSERDLDNDDIVDLIEISYTITIGSDERVSSIQTINFVDLSVEGSGTEIYTIGYIFVSESFPTFSSKLEVNGIFQFYQTKPLFNSPFLNSESNTIPLPNDIVFDVSELSFNKIINSFNSRNTTVFLDKTTAIWSPSSSATNSFTLDIIAHIHPQSFRYKPGFFETLKYAFVQYVCLVLLCNWISKGIRFLVFEQKLVRSRVEIDGANHKKLR